RPSRSSARVPAHGKNIRATPAVPGPNDALPCLLSPTVAHALPTNSAEPGLKTLQCSELETYPHHVRRLISHASPFHPPVVSYYLLRLRSGRMSASSGGHAEHRTGGEP